MISLRHLSLAALAALAALACSAIGCAADTDERPATFEYIVTTVLKPSCGLATCHSSMTRTEGLAFDTLEAAEEAFRTLPLAVPGELDQSQLIFQITDAPAGKRMPLDSPLPDADVALIERWILAGAVR